MQYGDLPHQKKLLPLSPGTKARLFGNDADDRNTTNKGKDVDNIEIFNIEIHSKYQPRIAQKERKCIIREELSHIPNEIRKHIIPNIGTGKPICTD